MVPPNGVVLAHVFLLIQSSYLRASLILRFAQAVPQRQFDPPFIDSKSDRELPRHFWPSIAAMFNPHGCAEMSSSPARVVLSVPKT